MPYEVIGIIAGILSLVGFIPYLVSILKHKTLPNKASWLIWTIVGALLALTYFAKGDAHAIWLPLGYFIGPLIVAMISLRYGYSVWSLLDKLCIVFACLSIIPWFLSKDPSITLIINVLIDAAGAIPTVLKTYRKPHTEDFTAWFIFLIANAVELLAIQHWNISAIYPVYLLILTAVMVIVMLCRSRSKRELLIGR